jgi:hypothetical protein
MAKTKSSCQNKTPAGKTSMAQKSMPKGKKK